MFNERGQRVTQAGPSAPVQILGLNGAPQAGEKFKVYDDENEIAGTSDIIADVDDKYFDVLDFKTNKKFLFFNKYNKYLLHPVSHLQECQYNDYSLQLSLYAYLYSLVTGKRLRQIRILYHDGNKFHTYPVPYLFWEIKALIKNHGQKSISESKTNPTAVQS